MSEKNGSCANWAVSRSRITKIGLEVVIAWDEHDPDEFDVLADEVKRVWDADTSAGELPPDCPPELLPPDEKPTYRGFSFHQFQLQCSP